MAHSTRIPILILSSLMLLAEPTHTMIDNGHNPVQSDREQLPVVHPMPGASGESATIEALIGHRHTASFEGPSETTMTGGSDEQRQTMAWALERYSASGLELPLLHIELHSDVSFCGGNRGFFSPSSTPWTIGICTNERSLVLHELGHAWVENTLSEADRASYVRHRGLESWNDPETPWRDRGSEHAANTMAWGLSGTPLRGMPTDGPLAERNAAFQFLTGMTTPRLSE